MNRYIIYTNTFNYGNFKVQKLINHKNLKHLEYCKEKNLINVYWLDKHERVSKALKQLDYYKYTIIKTKKYI